MLTQHSAQLLLSLIHHISTGFSLFIYNHHRKTIMQHQLNSNRYYLHRSWTRNLWVWHGCHAYQMDGMDILVRLILQQEKQITQMNEILFINNSLMTVRTNISQHRMLKEKLLRRNQIGPANLIFAIQSSTETNYKDGINLYWPIRKQNAWQVTCLKKSLQKASC